MNIFAQILTTLTLFLYLIHAYEIDCNHRNITLMEHQWRLFKHTYNKTYTGLKEARKKRAWIENCFKISKHNIEAKLGLHTYTLKANHISDMTSRSYNREMVKLTKSRRRKLLVNDIVGRIHHQDLPHQIDWREKGFITPAYNQKDCGSCYAFSVANVVQAQYFKKHNKLIPLSEQQLVDCSTKMGNYGCAGGSLRNTLRYIEKVGGLEPQTSYPYIAKQSKCKYNSHRSVANISSWAILPARDEHALKVAVAQIGPLAVSINASPHTFQLYHSGVYSDPACPSSSVNHAMLLIGYTHDSWILKNWWGEHWGENGYMRLKRHKNQCGIANYAAYATLD